MLKYTALIITTLFLTPKLLLANDIIIPDETNKTINRYLLRKSNERDFQVILKKEAGSWKIVSINGSDSISDPKEEILYVRAIDGGWEIEPYFDIAPIKEYENYSCNDKVPYKFDSRKSIQREKQTNLCDSEFMTNSNPDVIFQAGVTVFGALMTMGYSLAHQASTYDDKRYLNVKEIEKAVSDTNLNNILNKLFPLINKQKRDFSELENIWNDKLKTAEVTIKTKDKTNGLMPNNFQLSNNYKHFSKLKFIRNGQFVKLNIANKLPKNEIIKNLPTTVEKIAEWKIKQDRLLYEAEMATLSISAICTEDEILLDSGYRVNITECPKNQYFTDLPIQIPVAVTGLDLTVIPKIDLTDKHLKIWLKNDGLHFENITEDFIEIKDIALSINNKVYTLSSKSGESQLTIAPMSYYPASDKVSKFSLQLITHQEMLNALKFQLKDISEAKTSDIAISLSVRYIVNNTNLTQTLRGLNKINVHNAITSYNFTNYN